MKVYRCWQLWASQMRMSLLRSPEAYGDKDMSTYGDRGTHCVPFFPPILFLEKLRPYDLN